MSVRKLVDDGCVAKFTKNKAMIYKNNKSILEGKVNRKDGLYNVKFKKPTTTHNNIQDLKYNETEIVDEDNLEKILAQQGPQKSNQELLHEYASEALIYNKLTSSIAMEHIVTSLRKLDISKLYISEAYMCENLAANPEKKGWEHSFKYFKFGHASERKNGIYMCPLFTGNYSAGHWMLAVIEKQNEATCQGWTMDTLHEGREQLAYKMNKFISRTVGIANNISWKSQDCIPQQEMECGCRVIMMMLSICAGIQHGVELRENIQKTANVNGINIRNIPMVCRNLVHQSLQDFDKGWEKIINICGLNSMEVEYIRNRKRTNQKRSKDNGKQTHT